MDNFEQIVKENLKEGMVFKNRKAMCEALNVKPAKGGNNTKLQNKEFKRYFDWDNPSGRKIVITQVYNKPKEKIDNRGLNPNSHNNQNGAYGKYIRLLILDLLSKNERFHTRNKITIGKNAMLTVLDMINQNYRYGNYNRDKLANYLGIELNFVNEFFNTNTRKLRQSVERTLDKLEKSEKLILWNNIKMIKIRKEDGSNNYTYREATDKEVKFILNCEASTLEEMGTKHIEHIYASNRVIEFYLRVNKKLKEKNIECAYNGYKIVFSDLVYKRNEQMKYILDFEEEFAVRCELNDTVYGKLNLSAEDRHKNIVDYIKDNVIGIPKEIVFKEKYEYRASILDENFVRYNSKLIDLCITREQESIEEACEEKWKEYLIELEKENGLTEEQYLEIMSL